MTSILIVNGPNLNLLGTRQPEVYGAKTLSDVEALCRKTAERLGATVRFFQSNHEGALIDEIHAARSQDDGIVLNAGAYSHTSIALHDAILSAQVPTIEVHVSNIHAREPFRHRSFITPAAIGMISGLGIFGYALAVEAMHVHISGKER